jgi:hypothetical protein
MYLRLIWGAAVILLLLFAFEPYILSLIFRIPQSESSFFNYMSDVPITILALGFAGCIGAGIISLIPIKAASYGKRFVFVFPIVIILSTVYLIFGWAKGGYIDAQNVKKNDSGVVK